MKNLLGKSLRGRLTILYGLLLTLALALYAGGTSVYFLHNLRHQLDLSLDREMLKAVIRKNGWSLPV